jgi:hypothetical protein
MRTQTTPSCRIGSGFHIHEILGEATVDRSRGRRGPASARSTAVRPCDGCGDPDPTVDLWAEHSEMGEQIWLCAACGD